jgi:hypothetical protein
VVAGEPRPFDPSQAPPFFERPEEFEEGIWLRPNPELAMARDVLDYANTFEGYEYARIVLHDDLLEMWSSLEERCAPRHRAGASFVELRLRLFCIHRALRDQGRDYDGVLSAAEIQDLLAINRAICIAWERARGDVRRLATCSAAAVEAALGALDESPAFVVARDWPAGVTCLDRPGLYAWWVDEEGAAELSRGLGLTVEAGRIYAGQAGATKWPSGKLGANTLGKRIGQMHLAGKVRMSTFRWTLAALLFEQLGVPVQASMLTTPPSEQALSEWMRAHLSVAVHPHNDRDTLEGLERHVLKSLDPPLNLRHMQPTPVRARLTQLRRRVSRGA